MIYSNTWCRNTAYTKYTIHILVYHNSYGPFNHSGRSKHTGPTACPAYSHSLVASNGSSCSKKFSVTMSYELLGRPAGQHQQSLTVIRYFPKHLSKPAIGWLTSNMGVWVTNSRCLPSKLLLHLELLVSPFLR